MKVLFDESVRIDGEYSLAHLVWPQQTDFKAKAKQEGWKQKEIDCLDAVAAFCREKRIVPYTTDELYAEYSRGKTFPSRPYKKDVFESIKFETAPCPIKRSKWGISMKQYMDKQEVITFCNCFLSLSTAGIEKYISDVKKNPIKSLSAFEEKCLRNLNIFKKICHGI